MKLIARTNVTLIFAVVALLLVNPVKSQERPVLSFSVDRAIATEGTDRPVIIDLRLDRPAPEDGVCIDLDLAGGSARPGEDFQLLGSVPNIPAGGMMARVIINIIDDNQSEGDETIQIVLAPSPCYRIGDGQFTLLIRDDDDDAGSLALRLQQLVERTPDPLIATQLANLGNLCATDRPPAGSVLATRCQQLRLALRDPNAAQQLVDSLRGVVGEELSSQRRGFRQLASQQFGALGMRLDAVRAGGGAGLSMMDSGIYGSHGFLPLSLAAVNDGALQERGIGLFVSAVFGSGDRDATSLENGYDSDSRSFIVGVDKRFGTDWVVGLAYGRTTFDADLSADAGELDLDQDTLTGYVSYAFDGGWIDGSLGAGRGDISQTRIATFSGTTDEGSFSARDVLLGEADARLQTASVSAGWDWQRGRASFGPRLSIEHARLTIDAFAERAVEGSDAFAVELREQVIRSQIARAGFGAQWAISTRYGVLLPQLDAYAVRQFEDSADPVRGSFVNDPQSNTFLLPTSTIDSSYGEASVSLAMQFIRGHSGFVSYRRIIGLEDTEQSYWSLGWRMEF